MDSEKEDVNKALRERLGIKVAGCASCENLGYESCGGEAEYSVDWPVCDRFDRYQYLKPFPFKTDQECYEPCFWASRFTDMIGGAGDEVNDSVLLAMDAFNAERNAMQP